MKTKSHKSIFFLSSKQLDMYADDDNESIDDADGKSFSPTFNFSDSELHIQEFKRASSKKRPHPSMGSPNQSIEFSIGVHRQTSSRSARHESKRNTNLASAEDLQEEVNQKMDCSTEIDSNKKMRSDNVHSWTLKFLEADMENKVKVI